MIREGDVGAILGKRKSDRGPIPREPPLTKARFPSSSMSFPESIREPLALRPNRML
jgi:hypothetical protein